MSKLSEQVQHGSKLGHSTVAIFIELCGADVGFCDIGFGSGTTLANLRGRGIGTSSAAHAGAIQQATKTEAIKQVFACRFRCSPCI
jgi:hypothetical protein